METEEFFYEYDDVFLEVGARLTSACCACTMSAMSKGHVLPTRTINEAVVQGVVQVMLYLDREVSADRNPNMGDAYKEGVRDVQEHTQPSGFNAHAFILEFVKDGIVGLKMEEIDRVKNGDYSKVWMSTNRFLEKFGIPSVEPMQVQISASPA